MVSVGENNPATQRCAGRPYQWSVLRPHLPRVLDLGQEWRLCYLLPIIPHSNSVARSCHAWIMENHVGTIDFMPATAPIYRLTDVLTFGILMSTRHSLGLPTTFLARLSVFQWHSQSVHACKLGHGHTNNMPMHVPFFSFKAAVSKTWSTDMKSCITNKSGDEATWNGSMFNSLVPLEAVSLPRDELMEILALNNTCPSTSYWHALPHSTAA